MSVINRMKRILESPAVEEEGVTNASETNIFQHLALAAASMGVDVGDNDAVDQFIADIKMAATREKSQLKALLRRFSSSKAKAAAKSAVKTLS